MNRSTANWIRDTYLCRSCSTRVEPGKGLPDLLCIGCSRYEHMFPNGETQRKRRGHPFITSTMLRDIPVLYATEGIDCEDKTILAHYFVGSCDWYVTELEPVTGDAFGYADLGHGEWGYFNLVELESTLIEHWMVVERDLHFKPQTARELGIA